MPDDSFLVSQQDLEESFPPRFVRQVFTDDGKNPGPRLERAIRVGSQQASQILGKAWRDAEAVVKLVGSDYAARHAVCLLVMAAGLDGRPELYQSNGMTPAADYRKEARQVLRDIVERRLRSPGEREAGANRNRRARTVVVSPSFEFAPRNGRNPPGGF